VFVFALAANRTKRKSKKPAPAAVAPETGGNIKRWFDEAVKNKQAYLLIVNDNFDFYDENYPVMCKDAAECHAQVAAYSDHVAEIYDVRLGWGTLAHGQVSYPSLLPPQGDSSWWRK
jgi:hypothetical protein